MRNGIGVQLLDARVLDEISNHGMYNFLNI